MPDHISKELEAVIELTAEKVVEKWEDRFAKKLDAAIELHTLKCQNKKLGGFKAVVIGVLSSLATMLGNWMLKN